MKTKSIPKPVLISLVGSRLELYIPNNPKEILDIGVGLERAMSWPDGIITFDAYKDHEKWLKAGYLFTRGNYDLRIMAGILGQKLPVYKEKAKYLALFDDMYLSIILRNLGDVLVYRQRILELYFYMGARITMEDIEKISNYVV